MRESDQIRVVSVGKANESPLTFMSANIPFELIEPEMTDNLQEMEAEKTSIHSMVAPSSRFVDSVINE